jgi:hypothetical protein
MLKCFPPTTFHESNHLDLVTQPDPTNDAPTNRVKGPYRS